MNKKWSKLEEKYLIDNFYDMKNEEISKIINRSVSGIIKKAFSLKLKKNPSYKSDIIIKKNKKLGRDLTFENLKEIAKK
jgi:hypothetical protein